MYLGCSITKETLKLRGSAILHFRISMTSRENKLNFLSKRVPNRRVAFCTLKTQLSKHTTYNIQHKIDSLELTIGLDFIKKAWTGQDIR